jgi:hypothetical protein
LFESLRKIKVKTKEIIFKNKQLFEEMLDLSQNKDKNFSHFCNEWKEISKQLINCEKLLFQMSENDSNREELRQILKSIEPKKYSKNKRKRNQKTLHKLKELTQLLMTSDLKVFNNYLIIYSLID